MFHTTCQTTNTKETKKYKYTSDQIDYFITSFQDKVYVVPVEECSTIKTLRFSPPNNGYKNWCKAEDYLLENYFQYNSQYLDSKEKFLNRPITCKKENLESKKYYCSICGKEITYGANLCVECSRIQSRKIERPTREELKDLIRNNSFTQIGKQFGVSDNAIRKWCKAYNLPNRAGDIKNINEKDWINI